MKVLESSPNQILTLLTSRTTDFKNVLTKRQLQKY